jgi:hypothetical protein
MGPGSGQGMTCGGHQVDVDDPESEVGH